MLPLHDPFSPSWDEGIIAETERFAVGVLQGFSPHWLLGFYYKEKKNPGRSLLKKANQWEITRQLFWATWVKWPRLTLLGWPCYWQQTGDYCLNAPKSYAFLCRYCQRTLQKKVHRVSLLYHENHLFKRGRKSGPSAGTTALQEQAAAIARFSNAGSLLIGHFSSKYELFDDFFCRNFGRVPQHAASAGKGLPTLFNKLYRFSESRASRERLCHQLLYGMLPAVALNWTLQGATQRMMINDMLPGTQANGP